MTYSMLNDPEMRRIEPFLRELATVAADTVLPLYRTALTVDNKRPADFDPVTEADRTCEVALRRSIEAFDPAAGIVGEEYGETNADARDVWVLDPIDGTRAFIAGIPVWGVLAGLRREGRAVAGLMHQPFTGETFIGLHGAGGSIARYERSGAAMDLRTRSCADLEHAYAMTTAPELVTEQSGSVLSAARHVRYGGDCYAFCMLAMGQVDLVLETGLQPYDIMALIPIIEAAGGVVTTFDGGRPEEGGDVIAAGDPSLHAKALERLGR